ncbi:uncharacterized protein LOC101853661 isoform X2 [Aplysia californica]|uniref:Uncharacterized protein LOC101853661 isoform X2 n=1 Tax=Aplysia californica TaxID=6500 RepID=A0ABM1A3N0_APLCA|nr:uncharacterized protein LOC101853661 isoform X2 [Aplysia californica]
MSDNCKKPQDSPSGEECDSSLIMANSSQTDIEDSNKDDDRGNGNDDGDKEDGDNDEDETDMSKEENSSVFSSPLDQKQILDDARRETRTPKKKEATNEIIDSTEDPLETPSKVLMRTLEAFSKIEESAKASASSKTPSKTLQKLTGKKAVQRTPHKALQVTPVKKSKGGAKKRSSEVHLELKEKQSKETADSEWETDNDEESEDGDENIGSIDARLEEKASNMNMNAKNVKSIIHEEKDGSSEEKDSVTPKKFSPEKLDILPILTRAKVKDLVDKGSVPSPSKHTKAGPSILDVEFTEEEDDEEYDPNKDAEARDSDDDESVVSSRFSEIGSPYPLTPSSSAIPQSSEKMPDTPGSVASSVSASPAVVSSSKNLESAFNACEQASTSYVSETGDTIARRTRSKLPLTSTCITDIESAFVAPDITADMYDNTCKDEDWMQFLSSLYKPTDDTIQDDDANDPEFNYIAEAEKEEEDVEDFLFDKPSKITKKELNILISELEELFEEDQLPYRVVGNAMPSTSNEPQSTNTERSSNTEPSRNREPSSSTGHLHCNNERRSSNNEQPYSNNGQVCNNNNQQYNRNEQQYINNEQQYNCYKQQFHNNEQLYSNNGQQYTSNGQQYSNNNQQCGGYSQPYSNTRQPFSNQTPVAPTFTEFKTPLAPPSQSSRMHTVTGQRSSQVSDVSQTSSIHERSQDFSQQSHDAGITDEQHAIIEDHMRKHIQLLTQSFLLSQTHCVYRDLKGQPENFLRELDHFRKSSAAGTASVFNVCNLDPALEVLQEVGGMGLEPKKKSSGIYEAHIGMCKPLRQVVFNSAAFVYPQLLPSLRLFAKSKGNKYRNVMPSEDNLIALGLLEFRNCQDANTVDLIAELLLRGKDGKQVQHRIYRMCHCKQEQNVIKYVKQKGRLPPSFPKPRVDEFYACPPRDQLPHLLPPWLRRMQDGLRYKLFKEQDKVLKKRERQQQLEDSDSSDGQMRRPRKKPRKSRLFKKRKKHNHFSDSDDDPDQTKAPNKVKVLKKQGKQQEPLHSNSADGQRIADQKSKSKKILQAMEKYKPIAPQTVPQSSDEALSQTANQTPQGAQLTPAVTTSHPHSTSVGQPLFGAGTPPITGIYIQFGTQPSSVPVLPPQIVSNLSSSISNLTTSSSSRQRPAVSLQSNALVGVSPIATVSVAAAQKTLTKQVTSQSVSTKTSSKSSKGRGSSVLPQKVPPQSPDVLSHTLKSCGIIQSPGVNSPGQNVDSPLVDRPTLTSTPVSVGSSHPRRKHSSVRNLHNEFDNAACTVADDASLSEEMDDTLCDSVKEKGDANSQNSDDIEEESESGLYTDPTLYDEEEGTGLRGKGFLQDVGNVELNETFIVPASKSNILPGMPLKGLHPKGSPQEMSSPKSLPMEDLQTESLPFKHLQSQSSEQMESSQTLPSSKSARPSANDDIEMIPQSLSISKKAADGTHEEGMQNVGSMNESEESSSFTHVDEKMDVQTDGPVTLLRSKPKSLSPPQSNSLLGHKELEMASKLCSAGGSLGSDTEGKKVVGPGATSPSRETHISSGPQHALNKPSTPKKTPRRCRRRIEAQLKTPPKLQTIAPKALSPNQANAPAYVPLPKISPKRKALNQQVRHILPKSFTFEVKSPSPTKAAAMVLSKKAKLHQQQKSPAKILPMPEPAPTVNIKDLTPSKVVTRSQRGRPRSITIGCQKTPPAKNKCKTKATAQSSRDLKEVEETVSGNAPKPVSGEAEKTGTSSSQDQLDAEGALNSDTEDVHLDDLMAACTTIGYDPKKLVTADSDTKTKAQKRKDAFMAIFEPDIVDSDPKKDERDTAYAQHYFNRVKSALEEDQEHFLKFLTLLRDVNKDHTNPVELYVDMVSLLSDHQDLVDDFAGFLLSFQAVVCGCLVPSLEYTQIREILRKLEMYCDSSASCSFQRTLKMLLRWLSMTQGEQPDMALKERLMAIFKHVPGLMDYLMSYFLHEPIPDCSKEEFEDVDLEAKMELGDAVDEFEEINLCSGREDYNTKQCTCSCHQDALDSKLRRKITHCFSCSLQMSDGLPVLKRSRFSFEALKVIYPLEEKEKLARAKREAAKLALAKARSQKPGKKKGRPGSKRTRKKSVGSDVKLEPVVASSNANSQNPVLSSSSHPVQESTVSQAVQSPIVNVVPVSVSNKAEITSRALEATKVQREAPKETTKEAQAIQDNSSGTLKIVINTSAWKSGPSSHHTNYGLPSVPSPTISTVPSSVSSLAEPSVRLPSVPLTVTASSTPPQAPGTPVQLPFPVRPYMSPGLTPGMTSTPVATGLRLPVFFTVKPQKFLAEEQKGSPEPTVPAKKVPKLKVKKSQSKAGKSKSSKQFVAFENIDSQNISVSIQSRPEDRIATDASQELHVSDCPSSPLTEPPPVSPVLDRLNPGGETTAQVEAGPCSEPHTSFLQPEPVAVSSKGDHADSMSMASSSKKDDSLFKAPCEVLDLASGDSILQISPSKLRGKIPGSLIRSHLEHFSLGGFEESLDMQQIQQLAQAISPGKGHGESMSRFDLMAFLESSNLTLASNLTLKDSLFPGGSGTTESSSAGRVSFAGALSQHKTSREGTDASGQAGSCGTEGQISASSSHANEGAQVALQNKTDGPPEDHTAGSAVLGEDTSSSYTAPPSVATLDNLNWTEAWDIAILNVVTEEGVTPSAIDRLHREIPQKSLDEIATRAELLIQWVQNNADTDTESEAGS